MTKRELLNGLWVLPATLWLPSTLVLPSGCGGKPKTPLAHLYGEGWVTGAYEHYGDAYLKVQSDSEERSFEAYGVLAQKGVGALDKLQLREVPFHIRVDKGGERFAIERDVPERLTVTADMSEADKRLAEKRWKKAREHIHTDYVEIRRLNWALTRLLGQLQRIRSTIDNTREEQFSLTEQVDALKQGELPFELPYKVSSKDYERVIILLCERLESDRLRLESIETAIIAVGLLVRSTDARSASLAGNLRKVLLAVVDDATASGPRPSTFPSGEEQDKLLARGRELMDGIRKTEEYQKYLNRHRDAALEQIGSLLVVLDSITGISISSAYKKALTVFRGDADYLDYLELIASLSPSPELASAVKDGIGLTRKVRDGYQKAEALIAKGDKALADPSGEAQAALGALVNTGTGYATDQIDKQLVFFQDKAELDEITERLDATTLMSRALPEIPK